MTLLPDIERYIQRKFLASDRLAAEYLPKAGNWVRIRDLNEPIND